MYYKGQEGNCKVYWLNFDISTHAKICSSGKIWACIRKY